MLDIDIDVENDSMGNIKMRRNDQPLLVCFIVIGIVFAGIAFHLVLRLEKEIVKSKPFIQIDVEVSDISPAPWPHPIIHIINTRFQQEQAHLSALGRARLVLFETFCLNSIVGQTVLHDKKGIPFLWIIKVDPMLDEMLLREILLLVNAYEFIFVVASNVNFGVGQRAGGWRGGEAGNDVLKSLVYTGNFTLLNQAYLDRENKIVLETRVDADDGLHVDYVRSIQIKTLRYLHLGPNQTDDRQQRWLYFCSLRHIDWNPHPRDSKNGKFDYFGLFLPKKSPHVCITAGISVGLSVGVQEHQVPRFSHFDLARELQKTGPKTKIDCGCGSEGKCLRLLSTPTWGAIRSRTPTSAGMRDILIEPANFEKRLAVAITRNITMLTRELWQDFRCDYEQVIKAQRYLQDHLLEIVTENLQGQCTRGHSCKNSSKEILKALLETTE
jgi:hypothetical protein